MAASGRCKRDLAAIRAERRMDIGSRVVGYSCLRRAISMHDINFRIAIAKWSEGDLLAAATKSRFRVERRIEGKSNLVRTVGIHDVNLAIAVTLRHKRDFFLGRECGRR